MFSNKKDGHKKPETKDERISGTTITLEAISRENRIQTEPSSQFAKWKPKNENCSQSPNFSLNENSESPENVPK